MNENENNRKTINLSDYIFDLINSTHLFAGVK